jgi:hypothetical protein
MVDNTPSMFAGHDLSCPYAEKTLARCLLAMRRIGDRREVLRLRFAPAKTAGKAEPREPSLRMTPQGKQRLRENGSGKGGAAGEEDVSF